MNFTLQDFAEEIVNVFLYLQEMIIQLSEYVDEQNNKVEILLNFINKDEFVFRPGYDILFTDDTNYGVGTIKYILEGNDVLLPFNMLASETLIIRSTEIPTFIKVEGEVI